MRWTDQEIMEEYDRIEASANKTPRGADHESILHVVKAKSGRSLSDVRQVVIDNTFTRPN